MRASPHVFGLALAAFLGLPALAETPASAAGDVPRTLPSGLVVTLHQVIWPAEGAPTGQRRLRYRFVAPGIAAAAGKEGESDKLVDDMQFLCDAVVLPALQRDGRAVDEIVITLMARPVPFGTAAPDVAQLIDAYRPDGDHCEWEGL